ncbi:CAAX amino protease [Sporosarcina sp. NCCP-2716]|uniref:YhfC family glutamic-type intramembrane protease n=1 Tax=Sporosarcina sp. NCCP-2716 TaxID=2943679 RepID=UPI00203A7A8C|nr:YhfC family glutamic-type intramembrane protease [Sporosarcina sp. NCCP-2716]GKV69750.1 CAAX amino protease [Sporosarcina sp. NCCP-2716]
MAGELTAVTVGLILPAVLFIWALMKKCWIPFVLGLLAFTIAQLLIRLPLLSWLNAHSTGYLMWSTLHPVAFALFLALTAALAEELARFVAIRFFMRQRTWLSGVFFGAGHGGVEAVVLLGIPAVGLLAADAPFAGGTMLAVGSLERIFAITLHIGLSLLVLQSVKERRLRFLAAAIVIHMLADALVGILPMVVPPEWQLLVTESVIALIAIVLFVFTLRLKRKDGWT